MSCARVSRGRALSPTSRSALELRLCEPVSNRRRTGLRCAETEIGKYRAETTAPKAYFPRYNSAKVQPETGRIHPKPRECGSVPETEPVTNRDWNGWLWTQSTANLSPHLFCLKNQAQTPFERPLVPRNLKQDEVLPPTDHGTEAK